MNIETMIEQETIDLSTMQDEARHINFSVVTDSQSYFSYDWFCLQAVNSKSRSFQLLRETESVARAHFKAYDDGAITSLHCREGITAVVSSTAEYIFKKRGKHYSSFVTACAVLYLYEKEHERRTKESAN